MSRNKEIAIEIADLVDEKCEAYGDSLATTGAALRLLYPNGIQPDQYDDMLIQARIWDKQSRAAHRRNAFGEDPFRDMAGYALRAVELHERKEGEQGPCGCVSGAASRSTDSLDGSAPTSASEPIMPNGSEPNAPHSTGLNAGLSTNTSESMAAPARTATDLAFDDAVAHVKDSRKYGWTRIPRQDMRDRARDGFCPGCIQKLEHVRGPRVRRAAHGEYFVFCSEACYQQIWEAEPA